MTAIHHAVTIPSLDNKPAPNKPEDAEDVATEKAPWYCPFACTVEEHTDTVMLLWNGKHFSLPEGEANDPTFGEVAFTYTPPLQ